MSVTVAVTARVAAMRPVAMTVAMVPEQKRRNAEPGAHQEGDEIHGTERVHGSSLFGVRRSRNPSYGRAYQSMGRLRFLR